MRLIEEYQGVPVSWHTIDELDGDASTVEPAPMVTLCIMGGKKDKLRPGDVLGALTGDAGLTKEQVGKINVSEFMTYVALDRHVAELAFKRLANGNPLGADFGAIKGRNFKMRFIQL